MLKLREITTSDDSFLFALYASTRLDEVKLWGWDDQTLKSFIHMQWKAQKQSYVAQYPNLREQIALVTGERAGRLSINFANETLILVDISLLPYFRGQGYGRKLLEGVQQVAKVIGLPVRLNVMIGNPAKRLYERVGFRVTSSNGIREQMTWQPDSMSLGEMIREDDGK